MQLVNDNTLKALAQIGETLRKTSDTVAHALSVSPYVKKQKAQQAYCKVRAIFLNNFDRKLQTLAQVAASFTALSLPSSAPPGKSFSLNVLATCHASNAPGLSPIAMNYWQVRPRK
jgi:hypothetical protein